MKYVRCIQYKIAFVATLLGFVPAPKTEAALTSVDADVYDYSTQEASYIFDTIEDESYLDLEDIPSELDGFNTKEGLMDEQLFCMILKHKEHDDYIKYLFNSQGTWKLKAQKKPHKLGYHLVKAPAAHVALQALAFLQLQPSYDVYKLVLPSKSPLCFSCGSICVNLLDHQVAMNGTGCREKTFPKTERAHQLAIECFYSERFQDTQRRLVIAKIGEKCFPKLTPDFQENDDKKDDGFVYPSTVQSQLIIAVSSNFPLNLIKMLIVSCDINAVDGKNKTALDYASNNKEVYNFLRSQGAKTGEELEASRKKKGKEQTSLIFIHEDNSDQDDEKENYPTDIVKDQPQGPRILPQEKSKKETPTTAIYNQNDEVPASQDQKENYPMEIVKDQSQRPRILPQEKSKKETPTTPIYNQNDEVPAAQDQKENLEKQNLKIQQYKMALANLQSKAIPPFSEDPNVMRNLEKAKEAYYDSPKIRDIAYQLIAIDQMPPCIEKSVKQLLCYALLMQQRKQGIEEEILLSNGQMLAMDKPIFLQAVQEVQNEESLEKETKAKEELHAAWLAAKVDDWIKAKNILLSVKKKIQPLDFQETFWLVEQAEIAADMLEGQHTILFIGNTGAGKSTTLHTLAGSEMGMKTEIAEKDGKFIEFNHIAPVTIHNKALEKITTSPIPVSETRYISAFPVNLQEYGIHGAPMSTVLLCDTPGFEETRGSELGIANSVSIAKAFKQCKKIKPVLLIPYSAVMVDRMNPVRKLVHLLTDMLPNIKGQIHSFFYVFTQIEHDEQKEKVKKLFEFEEQNAKQGDPAAQAVIEDINEKLEKEEEAIFLDPLKDNPKKILKTLVKSSFIKDPADKFESYTTEQSERAIDHQAEKQRKEILAAARRQNYTLVAYKLDELFHLHEILPEIVRIQQKYDNVVEDIAMLWSDQYDKAYQQLTQELQTQPQLSASTLKNYHNTYLSFQQAEKMRAQHLPHAKEGQALLDVLMYALASLRYDIEQSPLTRPQLPHQLAKIKQISTSFPYFATFVDDIIEAMEKKIEQQASSLQQAIAQKQFQQAHDLMMVLRHVTQLQPFLGNVTIDPLVYQQKLIEKLTSIHQEAQDIIKRANVHNTQVSAFDVSEELLGTQEVNQLKKAYTDLSEAVTCFSYDPEEQEICTKIKALQTSLLNMMVDYVANCEQNIEAIFQEKQAQSFAIIRNYENSIEMIRCIEDVQMHTEKYYHRITQKLDHYVHQIFHDIEGLLNTLETFFSKDAKIDYERLLTCVTCLQETTWIEESQTLLERTKKEFLTHMNSIRQQTDDIEIQLDEHNTSLQQVSRLLQHLKELQVLKNIMPDITQESRLIHQKLASNFKMKLEEIQTQFDIEKSSLASRKKAGIALHNLQNIQQKKTEIGKTLSQGYQKSSLPGAQKAILEDEMGTLLYVKCQQQHMTELGQALSQRQAQIEKIKSAYQKEVSQIQASIQEMECLKEQYNDKKIAIARKSSVMKTVLGRNEDVNAWFQNKHHQSIEGVRQEYDNLLDKLATIQRTCREKINPLQNQQVIQQKQYDHIVSIVKTYEQDNASCDSQIQRCERALQEVGYDIDDIRAFIHNKISLQKELEYVKEQIKENQGAQYRFDQLNPQKAELALDFLEKAQQIFSIMRPTTSYGLSQYQAQPYKEEEEGKKEELSRHKTSRGGIQEYRIKKHIKETLRQLKEYLTLYGQALEAEVMLAFSELENISDFEKEKEAILKKSQYLSMRFKELGYLAEKYPYILRFFKDDIKKSMLSRLEKLGRDLEEKLTVSAQRKERVALTNAIKLAKVLRLLDAYTNTNECFHTLYKEYQSNLYGQVSQAVLDIFEDISNAKYNNVLARIGGLRQLAESGDIQAKKSLQTVQEYLFFSLQDLLKDTYTSILLLNERDIELESVNKLNEQLDQVEMARKCFFRKEKYKHPILNDNERRKLQRSEERIEQSLAYWMQDVKKYIKGTIHMHNFAEAEEKIKQFKRILKFLGDHYNNPETEGRENEDNTVQSTSIQDSRDLEQVVEDELASQVTYYKGQSITTNGLNPYMSKPPKVLHDKLKKAMVHEMRYREIWQQIEKVIQDKFIELLQKAYKEKDKIQRKKYLSMCERILKSLPDYLKESLSISLEETKEQIETENETLAKEIEDAFSNESIVYQIEVLKKLDKSQSNEHIYSFKKNFKETIGNIVEGYNTSLQQDDIQEAYGHLCKLAEYEKSFGKTKDLFINDVYQRAIKRLESKIYKSKKTIEQNLKPKPAIPSKQQAERVKKAFRIMTECQKCIKAHKNMMNP